MLPGEKFQADEGKNNNYKQKTRGKRLQKINTIWCLGCNLPESIFRLEQVLQSVLRCLSVHSPCGVLEHLVHILQKAERTPKHPSTNDKRESWSCFVLKSIWIPNIVIATLNSAARIRKCMYSCTQITRKHRNKMPFAVYQISSPEADLQCLFSFTLIQH